MLPATALTLIAFWTLSTWQAAIELVLKVQINTTVTGHKLTDMADIYRTSPLFTMRHHGKLTDRR